MAWAAARRRPGPAGGDHRRAVRRQRGDRLRIADDGAAQDRRHGRVGRCGGDPRRAADHRRGRHRAAAGRVASRADQQLSTQPMQRGWR